jgi:peroxiredoxin
MTDAVITIIGILTLFNLALSLGLTRQTKRYGEALKAARPQGPQPWHLKIGTKAPSFTATTTAGDTWSLDDLAGSRALIAFFTVVCPACRTQAVQLREYAKSVPGNTRQILAVIVGRGEMANEFGRELEGLMSVSLEQMRGPVTTAFSLSSYPTFYLIGKDGRIETSGVTVSDLPAMEKV